MFGSARRRQSFRQPDGESGGPDFRLFLDAARQLLAGCKRRSVGEELSDLG